MESDDDILQRLAKDGFMDYSSWPIVLPGLVARIEKNAHTQFPVPNIRSPPSRIPAPRFLAPLPASDPAAPPNSSSPAPDSQDDKENAGPSSSMDASTAPSSLPGGMPGTNTTIVTGLTQPPVAPGSLPAPIAALLEEITSTIIDRFNNYPPHTIQRLAELVLKPRQHYRSLVAYLHALDRVVHVSSGSNIYPLPPAVSDMSQMSLTNGVGVSNGSVTNTTAANSPGSDEALGGALLTPIPWLSQRANGGGSSEDGTGSEDGSMSSPVSTRSDPVLAQVSSPQQQQQQQTAHQAHPQRSSLQDASSSTSSRPQIRTDSTETIEGPNGMGTIETVSVSMVNGVPSMTSGNTVLASRGITQGELLRQEQRAGVVPFNQLVRQQQQLAQAQAQAQNITNHNKTTDGDNPSTDTDIPMDDEQGQEAPHARGPEEIDDADIGPQRAIPSHPAAYTIGTGPDGTSIQIQGIDIEAAVGRHEDGTPLQEPRKTTPDHDAETTVPQSPKREAEEDIDELASKKQKVEGEEDSEKDRDTVMVSADVPSTPNGAVEGEVVITSSDPSVAASPERNKASKLLS